MIVSYVSIIAIFIILSIISMFIEKTLMIVMNNILITIILLGILFISLVLFLFGILCLLNKSARDLFDRMKLLLKNII